MAKIQRVGDKNSGGGVITTTPQSSVTADNKLVSVNGAMGTTHAPGSTPHKQGIWKTAGGDPNVTVENKPVNFEGNTDSCGHKRQGGGTSFE